MKKFIVKYKDGGKVYGEYSSRKEASDKLIEHINNFNKYFEGEYLSPFDFVLEVVECDDVNEEITDFESAKRYLNQKKGLSAYGISIRSTSVCVMRQRFFEDIDDKNLEALIALNQLFTIAEAWNKADGFVPDFNNYAQKKWVPTFEYNDDYTGLDFWASTFFSSSSPYDVGFRLCFKTKERAEQFGKQFIELYNKAFLSNK